MPMCEKILISGFSGSGKSTLLDSLKKNAPEGWEHFEDLDELILLKYGVPSRTLSDLIGRHGWEKFRLWERQELEYWLKQDGKGVLSLGGGSLTGQVMAMLQSLPKVKLVHLYADFETCWQRLMADQEEPRPLVLKGKEELKKIYFERQKQYQMADLRFNNPPDMDIRELSDKFWEEVLAP